MMMQLNYLFCKASKKCRELKDLIVEISERFDTSEFPISGGRRPIRAYGTLFITHKVPALNRIIYWLELT